jgi:4-alpha-glucanotransferase
LSDAEKTFRAPALYPEQSMAVATTHDLPTLRGYWESGDLTLGKALGLYPDEVVLRGLYQDRELAKQGLLDALHKYGCLPKRAGHKASDEHDRDPQPGDAALYCRQQQRAAGPAAGRLAGDGVAG